MAEKGSMLSVGKWAAEWGVTPAKVKKAIKELNVQPDMKKSGCAYYSDKTAAKIKKAVD